MATVHMCKHAFYRSYIYDIYNKKNEIKTTSETQVA
jgi:hypothetical protein